VRRQAERLLVDGRTEEAAALFRALLETDPGRADLWTDVGFVLADLGLRDEALAHYQRALELDPRCSSAWVGRGMQFVDDPAEALRCFEHAVEAAPDNANAWFLKSMSLDDLGRREEAASARRRASELDPGIYSA